MIFLTNDSGYLTEGNKQEPIDKDFRLHEGNIVCGERRWSPLASPGTIKGKESSILLNNSYAMKWMPYSKLNDNKGKFSVLILKVEGNK